MEYPIRCQSELLNLSVHRSLLLKRHTSGIYISSICRLICMCFYSWALLRIASSTMAFKARGNQLHEVPDFGLTISHH